MMASSRGKAGLWAKYNRQLLDLKEDEHFKTNYMAFVLKCLLMCGEAYHLK